MNITSHYPWPVLGDNDAVSGIFTPTTQIDLGRETIKIRGNFTLDNKTIQALISEGKANYLLQITCIATHIRQCYLFTKNQFEIVVPSTELRGMVRLDYFVVATKEISDYINEGAHFDYEGARVSLTQGDVIAEAQPEKFEAKKKYAGTKSVSDFLEVIRDPALTGPMIIDSNQDKIIVRLPSFDFEKLAVFAGSKTEKINSILQSSVAFPAILIALQDAFEDNSYCERFVWFNILKGRAEKANIEWSKENISQIAQEVLRKPVERMLSGLKEIIDSTE